MDLWYNGFVKHGFVKGGFVKYGFVKGGFVKHGFVKEGPVRNLDLEKQTSKANNLFVWFTVYQFSALLSPFIKSFEICIPTSPFYCPSLRLSCFWININWPKRPASKLFLNCSGPEIHENSGNSKGGLRFSEKYGSLNAAISTRGRQLSRSFKLCKISLVKGQRILSLPVILGGTFFVRIGENGWETKNLRCKSLEILIAFVKTVAIDNATTHFWICVRPWLQGGRVTLLPG